jgi:hypothetical protein
MKKQSILVGTLLAVALSSAVLLVRFILARVDRDSSGEDDYPTNEKIARLAKLHWEEEGHPEGRAQEHWLRAERELREQFLPAPIL